MNTDYSLYIKEGPPSFAKTQRQGHSRHDLPISEWRKLFCRRQPQELGRYSSRSVGDQPFAAAGFPWSLPSSYMLSGPLGALTQTSSGSLSRLPSQADEVALGLQRELSAERGRMGRISLSQSMDSMQQ